jgi:hypothetical protein
MTLRITDCKASPSSIRVFFSDAVIADNSSNSATNPDNYQIATPIGTRSQNISTTGISYDQFRQAVYIPLRAPPASLVRDSFLGVVVSNVQTPARDQLPQSGDANQDFFATRVNGGDGDDDKEIRNATRAAEDAVAFPLLTEEVGFAPSPLARPSGTPSGGYGPTSLGQTVTQAVSDVLGWKIKPDDPKGFAGALTASFTCADVEGHTQCTWTPRTYAVQTDLSGGITGAQASLYSRAQDALNQSLPLLDGLYPLDPEADAEDIAALKGVARSQLIELVNELGMAGGPRVSRVNQYFQLLLQDPGTSFPPPSGTPFVTDPDQIKGTLGSLRDELGLNFTTQDFVNTVQDEQDLSNFRILSDYVTSLAQSWINNLRFFGLNTATPFFGTQLVLLSRQLSVVAESVDEVRFTLDSVFIGPAERQTLELQFAQGDQPLFAEDLFNWIQSFATDEGPRLIQDGGKFGVHFSFLPIAQQLQHLVNSVQDPNPRNRGLPPGFHTFRVQRSLNQLGDELDALVDLATPISHVIEVEPTKTDFDALRQEVALLATKPPILQPGPTLVAIPPQLVFTQPQRVSTDSPPQLLTIFNVGSSPASVGTPTVSPIGTNPPEFKIIEPDPFPTVLASQATLAVSITFTPTEPGPRETQLTVPYNGVGTTTLLQISLKGTGVAQRS